MKQIGSPLVSHPGHRLRNYHHQFQIINSQNLQLLKLANTIEKSSFLQLSPPPLLYHLELELRNNLVAFVDSIREFFIDIDQRLRTLAAAFTQQLSEENMPSQARLKTIHIEESARRQHLSNQNIVFKINQAPQDPYQLFAERISILETSLKQTQENEVKLLEIVDKLSKKTEHISQYAPSTHPEVRPVIYPNLARQTSKTSFKRQQQQFNRQNSFRLFALESRQNQALNAPRPVAYSSFKYTSPPGIPIREVAQRPPFQGEQFANSNHNHRANYMLRTLIS